MGIRLLFLLSLFVLPVAVFAGRATGFSTAAYYDAMASDNLDRISAQEKLLDADKNRSAIMQAYYGALLMKKAGLISGPAQKLSTFKDGHELLEAEIKKDGDNAELRFLRLMIQEHAPKIVKYRDEIETDRLFIKQNFKQLKPEVQQAVVDYAKKYNTLKPSDFNQASS